MILNISTAFSDMMKTLSIYIYRYSCHKLIKYASLNLYINHCFFVSQGHKLLVLNTAVLLSLQLTNRLKKKKNQKTIVMLSDKWKINLRKRVRSVHCAESLSFFFFKAADLIPVGESTESLAETKSKEKLIFQTSKLFISSNSLWVLWMVKGGTLLRTLSTF